MTSLPITIYEYLKMDHQKVADWFSQFEKAPSKERKHAIVEMIADELLVHAHSEQETFYRVLKKYYESEEAAFHGQEEHEEIEQQIALIRSSTSQGNAWEKRVLKLKDLVEHHVKDEEGKIFKKAKKVLSDEETIAIKEQMHFLKMKMMRKIK